MKRIKMFIVVFGLLTVLTACGNNNSNVPNNNDGVHTENTSNNRDVGMRTNDGDRVADEYTSQAEDEMQAKMDELGLSEISVEVKYNNDQEYEAEIDQDENEPIRGKVDDELNGVLLRGGEAFNHIVDRAEKLNLTTESNDQEIIKQVLEVFDLPEDYVEFEFEIEFNNGKKIEVEDRK
ncbi:YusW family protein [Pseudogracilibacillus sp. SO30301A]|uniref:YusW family protein n=1 Tax=Pseudogracilibacillus sp. SO30301A TaxID=3098291 RepID=UPI00300E5BE1